LCVSCRHTARFLFAWLTLLPFALYPTTGWGVVPVCTGIAAVLCGIEEIGVQCEEPFGILPLDVICNRIQARPHRRSCIGPAERLLVRHCAEQRLGP
jgi:predicted membrane chloride channel (bestrophin family)